MVLVDHTPPLTPEEQEECCKAGAGPSRHKAESSLLACAADAEGSFMPAAVSFSPVTPTNYSEWTRRKWQSQVRQFRWRITEWVEFYKLHPAAQERLGHDIVLSETALSCWRYVVRSLSTWRPGLGCHLLMHQLLSSCLPGHCIDGASQRHSQSAHGWPTNGLRAMGRSRMPLRFATDTAHAERLLLAAFGFELVAPDQVGHVVWPRRRPFTSLRIKAANTIRSDDARWAQFPLCV